MSQTISIGQKKGLAGRGGGAYLHGYDGRVTRAWAAPAAPTAHRCF